MIPSPATVASPPHFALRMWLFFAGFFVVGGIAIPFYPVWLEGRGLSDTEIAACIAVPMLVRVLLTPFAGVFADRAPNRRFAVIVFTVPAALIFLAAWPAQGFWPIMLITGSALILWQLALPVGEALALTGVRRFGLDYGRMRVGGSVAFVLTNLGAGAVLGYWSSEAIFWMIAAALGLRIVVAWTLPVTPRAIRALDDAERPRPKRFTGLLWRPPFLALCLVGALVQASHAVLYGFGSLYWQSLGFGGFEIGVFWAIAVVGEIVLFAWSGWAVGAVGPLGLLALGAAAAAIRWAFSPFDVGLVGFGLLQALHALTFGAVYLGNQHAIARTIPEEMTATAQGVLAMFTGVVMAAATAIAGPLYERWGADAFLFMIALPAVSLLILAWVWLVPGRDAIGAE